jgi:colicin import membrane protein
MMRATLATQDWQPLASESSSQRLRSLLFTLLLHAGLFGLMFVGFSRISVPKQELAGEPIEAVYVDLPKTTLKVLSSIASRKTATAPKQVKTGDASVTEYRPNTPPPPETPDLNALEQQKQEDQQKAEDLARQQALDELLKMQAATDADQKKLEEEQAQRKAEQARTLAQIAEEDAILTGTVATDDLLQQYVSALHMKIEDNSRINSDLGPGVSCILVIRQSVIGEVIEVYVKAGNCNASNEQREELVESVRRASPLPFEGFEKVFRQQIIIPFGK